MDGWDLCVGGETQVGCEHVCGVWLYAGKVKLLFDGGVYVKHVNSRYLACILAVYNVMYGD